MKKYVVLLRGVNAGGNNRVPNAEFQQVLESLGFRDVQIYINSGNAIFSSESIPSSAAIQTALESHFGFPIPTLLLMRERVLAVADAIPPEWTNDPLTPERTGQRSDVLYLFDGINTASVLEQIGHRPKIETMLYVDGAVLANVMRKNQTKYSLSRIIGTPLYRQMTVRNIHTAKKLAELVR